MTNNTHFILTVAVFHHRHSNSIEYEVKCYSVLTSNTMKLNKISVGRPVPHSQLDIYIYIQLKTVTAGTLKMNSHC